VELTRRTPYILIANNEHAMSGSKPWERERMDEGALWVYVLRDRSRMALLRVLFGVLTGRLKAEDEFDRIRASDVWIKTGRRRVDVSIDGEIVTMDSPLHFRSRPRELRVVVPVDSRRAQAMTAEKSCAL
jgi:diacylglycerol kinase family enzyme